MTHISQEEISVWENPLGIKQMNQGLDVNVMDAVFNWYFFGLKPGRFTMLLLDANGELGFPNWESIPDDRKIEMIRAAHPMIRNYVKAHWHAVRDSMPAPDAKWDGWREKCLSTQSKNAIIFYLSNCPAYLEDMLYAYISHDNIKKIIGSL